MKARDEDEWLARVRAGYARERPVFYAVLRSLEAALLRPHLEVMAPPRLDFGCGDGSFARQLAGNGFFDFGLDVDPHVAGQAAGVYGRFLCWTGGAMPVADASLGTLLANSVLEHIGDVPAVLREWRRSVRPGGRAYCTITLAGWDDAMPVGLRGVIRRVQRHKTLWSAEAWRAAFAAHGFDCEAMHGYAPPALARRVIALHLPAVALELFRRAGAGGLAGRLSGGLVGGLVKGMNYEAEAGLCPLDEAGCGFFILRRDD